jgi:tetratricopeptide (TPR) repeat protein
MAAPAKPAPAGFLKRNRWRILFFAWVGLAAIVFAIVAGRYLLSRQQARRGEEALDRHDYEAARACFARSLNLWPGQADVHYLAARADRRGKHYDDAAEHLRTCARLGWNQNELEVEWALADLQKGERRAEAFLQERLAQDDPQTVAILEVFIQYYLDDYRLTRALECLKQYLERRPTDIKALLGRAFIFERLLYFKDALQDYRRAVELEPYNDQARLGLANSLLLVGTPKEALEHYRILQKKLPENLAVRLGLAKSLRREGRSEEARAALKGILRENSRDAEALTQLGQMELEDNKPAEAERWLRLAVEETPWNREANFNLAEAMRRQGNKQSEEKKIKQTVARIDADLKEMDKISRLVMKWPNDAALRCKGGILFIRNGQEEEGIRWLKTALRLDPNYEPARKALADLNRNRPGVLPPSRRHP